MRQKNLLIEKKGKRNKNNKPNKALPSKLTGKV